jgi:hypothetical protein
VVEIQRPTKVGGIYCEEARRLLNAFGETIHELGRIHQQQFEAIVEGDLDSTRFDLLIHMTNEKKYAAKYAYLTHVEDHGCLTFHETDKS